MKVSTACKQGGSLLALLFVSSALSPSDAFVLLHPRMPSVLSQQVAHLEAMHTLWDSSCYSDVLLWFAGEECQPVNKVHEKISQSENATTLLLSVKQSCTLDTVEMEDLEVTVDASGILSIKANLTSGDQTFLEEQYQIPPVAAVQGITAVYTAEGILHITIPHMAAPDIISNIVPVTIEPKPIPKDTPPVQAGNKAKPETEAKAEETEVKGKETEAKAKCKPDTDTDTKTQHHHQAAKQLQIQQEDRIQPVSSGSSETKSSARDSAKRGEEVAEYIKLMEEELARLKTMVRG